MLLVRDAAARNHPIIGIAAQGSAIAQQKIRDEWIGWDQETFLQKGLQRHSQESPQSILKSLDGLIRGLYVNDLLGEHICHLVDIEKPTDRVIEP